MEFKSKSGVLNAYGYMFTPDKYTDVTEENLVVKFSKYGTLIKKSDAIKPKTVKKKAAKKKKVNVKD